MGLQWRIENDEKNRQKREKCKNRREFDVSGQASILHMEVN
jgi:hypothetical protein